MKTKFLSLLCIFFTALLLCVACNQHDTVKEANEANKANTDSAATASPAVAVNTADAEFATTAANAGMMEVQLGNTAMQISQNKQVKDFGAMMVKDHTKAGNELDSLAKSKNLTLPSSLGAGDQKMVDDITKKTGAAFDKAYTDMMVNDHEKVIDAFRKEANDGKDADLKSFASNTLPLLEKHLAAAQAAQKTVKSK